MNSATSRNILYILISLGILYMGVLQGRFGSVLPIGAILIGVQIFSMMRARRSLGDAGRIRRTASVLREAEKLEKKDPAAAHQMLEEHFTREDERESRELAELRTKAGYDTTAAKELEHRLRGRVQAEKRGPIILSLVAFVQRFPAWLRPSLYGAGLLFAMMAFRLLVALTFRILNPRDIPQLGLGLLIVTAAGGVGGLGYSLIGRRLRPIPAVGPYFAGIVAVASYMGALLVAMPFIDPSEHLISDRTDAMVFGIVTTIFGAVFGHAAFRDKAAD